MNRRYFLRGLAAAAGLAPIGPSLSAAWAAPGSGSGRALVVIFLRGGCDGLNMVVPHGDDAYYAARPGIAIAPPRAGGAGAALDLDGFFGLHPALAPLQAIYGQGRLALLPAVHFPEAARSHFVAQALLERAGGAAGDGWLNRYVHGYAAPGRSLAISSQLPEAMQGRYPLPSFATPLDPALSGAPIPDAILGRVLTETYISGQAGAGEALGAWDLAARDLDTRRARIPQASAEAATYPNGALGRDLAAAAALLRDEAELSVVMVSDGGWDTHAHQGGATGRQATQLANLAAALAAFDADLGARRNEVAVLVQTEFGRTLRENASGGTDHGGASAWMVLSSTLRGGIHLGGRGWPGLAPANLLDGRALAPAVDFRDVYADLLRGHLGCPDLGSILPGRPGLGTGLV